MKGHVTHIERDTLANEDYRRVLFTVPNLVIASGVEHNVVDTSKAEALSLYTAYGPPEHPDGTVQRTKADEPAGH